MITNDTFLWVEKYRPKTVDECILPAEVKANLSEFVKSGQIPHLLFAGTAGVGKTTVAKAIASSVGADLLYINASNENGIDMIRNKIVQFASTASFEGNLKIVLLDESDGISASAQAALRGVTEEFHKTTRFIFTCNFVNKMIEPLQSRCSLINFKIPENERKVVMATLLKRVCDILKAENVTFDPKVVVSLVQKHFPDFRKVLNELQRYSASGSIDTGILVDQNTTFEELTSFIKDKKFGDARKWLARNPDLEHQSLFRYFYDNLDLFDNGYKPNLILTLAQYQNMSSSVVDQEINSMACLVEIMGSAVWK